MKPAPFEYVRPRTVEEALDALGGPADAKVLAGGQSLVPMMNMRLVRPARVVDLNFVGGLSGIEPDGAGGLRLGALVRHTDVVAAPLVRERFPLLAAAAAHVGHRAIRNRGTLGGSIAHADPAAELPAALLALEATVVAAGRRGHRRIAARDFFVGPLTTALAADEIVVEIHVPDAGRAGWGFAEIARRAGDFAIAGVAAVVAADGAGGISVRLAAFGVDDRPVRLRGAEAVLTGTTPGLVARAAAAAADDCRPSDDVHASADYRRHLVTVLVERVVPDAVRRLANLTRAPSEATR